MTVITYVDGANLLTIMFNIACTISGSHITGELWEDPERKFYPFWHPQSGVMKAIDCLSSPILRLYKAGDRAW